MKTRRALSLVLVIAMILSIFTMVLPAGAAPAEMRIASRTRSRTNYTYYTDEQLMDMLQITDPTILTQLRLSAHEAIMSGKSWNVTSFGLKNEGQVFNGLRELIWGDPELFFVYGIGGYTNSSNVITTVTYTHLDSYEVSMAQHAALEVAAQEIMCLFQRTELSDPELAVLIHDYLAANYEYHLPTLDLDAEDYPILGKFSAYNLLVEGTAVCQGYAEAYAYLMMQFGINCGLCMSDTLNHAWNIIELDGKEYQLDVTWDDPTPNVYGKTTHSNMLLSTTAFKVSHVAEDFTGNPENTEFDTAFWQGINTPFCLVGDTIYFISTDQKLCSWDHTGSSDEIVELMDLSAKWYAKGNGAWSGYYSCLATDGERLFYSTPSEVREYFPESNTTALIYAPEAKTDEGTGYRYNIFGFDLDGKDLRLNYYYTPNLRDYNIAESILTYTFREEVPELHKYNESVVVTAPTCHSEGEARYDCIYCGFSKTETLPADPDGHVYSEEGTKTKEPTCKDEGEISYKCLYCDAVKTEPIAVVDHNWLDATCTTPITCSYCGEEQEGETGYILQDPTAYVPQNGDQIVIAVNNNGTYRAMSTGTSGRLDGADLAVVDGKITSDAPPVWIIETMEDGFALMTNGKYLTRGSSTNFSSSTNPYKWILTSDTDGYQFTANTDASRQVAYQLSGNRFAPYSNTNTSGYIFTLQFFKYMEGGGALGHTKVTVPGMAATCTEDGLTDGSKCSVCGETITEQEVIPAAGHTEVEVAGKAATCTEDGLTDGIKCSVCGETIQKQEVIPATGHTEKQVEASDPTCTEPGKSAGTICATCGISLSEQEATPALGHEEKYTPNSNGTHTITCTRCDLSETVECTYTNGVCDFCDYEEPVSEGGYEKVTSIAVGDTVILVCEAVSKEMSGFIQSTTYGDGADYAGAPTGVYPLVVEQGYTAGTYAFKTPDGKYFYHSGSKNTLSLNGSISKNSSWMITFDSNGNAIITNCATTSRNIRWNKNDPRFATYTSTQTAVQFYKYVSASTGECEHEWDNGAVTVEPKCNAEGLKVFTCTLCGETYEETLSTVDHAWVAGPVVEPTCTEDGYTLYTCLGCNDSYKSDIIPTTGHTWVAATCDRTGYCEVCDTEGGAYFAVESVADLSDNDRIIIVAKVGEEYFALNTILNDDSRIDGIPTAVYGNSLTGYNDLLTWTLVETEEGLALYSDSGYLRVTKGDKTFFGFSDEAQPWTFADIESGITITSVEFSNRGILLQAGSANVFGAYAVSYISNVNYYGELMIFKYEEGSTVPHFDNSVPKDNICDGCGSFIQPVALISRSISLNGNIAVNFYMSLCDEVSSDPNAYMLFKQEGKEDCKVYIKDCVEKQVRGKDAYIFSYEVAAKEMTDTITAQFFYGDTYTEAYTYSVKTYADNQRTNLSDNKALMNLLDAMLHYGAASQVQFDYHTERLADADLEKADYSGVTIDGYPLNLPQGTDLVAFAGASLILKSETTLRYFFRVDPSVENLTVTYNGTPLEVVIRNGLYCVDIENISAPTLDQEFTITLHDGVQQANVTYSPLTYCQSIRGKDTSSDALKDVCAALYLYNQAANNFF